MPVTKVPGHVPLLQMTSIETTIGFVAAIGAGEFSLFLLVLIAFAVPIAAISFARSGRGLEQLGKGRFSVDFESDGETGDPDGVREEELRQMVEARAWRRENRGDVPPAGNTEIEQLLGLKPDPEPSGENPERIPGSEAGLRAEIRQVVEAKNQSRLRRGEQPLDVEAEIERFLRELA